MHKLIGYRSFLKVPDAFNTFSIHVPLLSLRFIGSMFSVTMVNPSDDWPSLRESESSQKSKDNIKASLSAVAIAEVGRPEELAMTR